MWFGVSHSFACGLFGRPLGHLRPTWSMGNIPTASIIYPHPQRIGISAEGGTICYLYPCVHTPSLPPSFSLLPCNSLSTLPLFLPKDFGVETKPRHIIIIIFSQITILNDSDIQLLHVDDAQYSPLGETVWCILRLSLRIVHV